MATIVKNLRTNSTTTNSDNLTNGKLFTEKTIPGSSSNEKKGVIAINYAEGFESLSILNSADKIVPFDLNITINLPVSTSKSVSTTLESSLIEGLCTAKNIIINNKIHITNRNVNGTIYTYYGYDITNTNSNIIKIKTYKLVFDSTDTTYTLTTSLSESTFSIQSYNDWHNNLSGITYDADTQSFLIENPVTFNDTINTTKQIVSTVATGAPISVKSTTKCTNLNADMLDGKHSTDFAPASTAHTHGNKEAIDLFYTDGTILYASKDFEMEGNADVDVNLTVYGTITANDNIYLKQSKGIYSDVDNNTTKIPLFLNNNNGVQIDSAVDNVSSANSYVMIGSKGKTNHTTITSTSSDGKSSTLWFYADNIHLKNGSTWNDTTTVKVNTQTGRVDTKGEIVTQSYLSSTVATGTAPISVTSTTVCPNLNAQLFNGKKLSDLSYTDSGATSSPAVEVKGVPVTSVSQSNGVINVSHKNIDSLYVVHTKPDLKDYRLKDVLDDITSVTDGLSNELGDMYNDILSLQEASHTHSLSKNVPMTKGVVPTYGGLYRYDAELGDTTIDPTSTDTNDRRIIQTNNNGHLGIYARHSGYINFDSSQLTIAVNQVEGDPGSAELHEPVLNDSGAKIYRWFTVNYNQVFSGIPIVTSTSAPITSNGTFTANNHIYLKQNKGIYSDVDNNTTKIPLFLNNNNGVQIDSAVDDVSSANSYVMIGSKGKTNHTTIASTSSDGKSSILWFYTGNFMLTKSADYSDSTFVLNPQTGNITKVKDITSSGTIQTQTLKFPSYGSIYDVDGSGNSFKMIEFQNHSIVINTSHSNSTYNGVRIGENNATRFVSITATDTSSSPNVQSRFTVEPNSITFKNNKDVSKYFTVDNNGNLKITGNLEVGGTITAASDIVAYGTSATSVTALSEEGTVDANARLDAAKAVLADVESATTIDEIKTILINLRNAL